MLFTTLISPGSACIKRRLSDDNQFGYVRPLNNHKKGVLKAVYNGAIYNNNIKIQSRTQRNVTTQYRSLNHI